MAPFAGLFGASKVQVSTYLLGVALFSISFLVYLNSSVSFVVTDLIGQEHGVGDAVGSLGFADELVALAACPLWGLLSDRIGVRNVSVLGYTLVGIALFVFVQARNVYPQLLLARIFFSMGGAAVSTMVTAILPAVISERQTLDVPDSPDSIRTTPSESTVTPSNYRGPGTTVTRSKSPASQVAGLVGMFTGLGALLALGLFLPLPARLSKAGYERGEAVKVSFYIVGAVALAVALVCFVGLRNLERNRSKGWAGKTHDRAPPLSMLKSMQEAVRLGFVDSHIGLGYLGGFVARASSVAISLFIPLFVNAYFIRTGLCEPGDGAPKDPSQVREQCRRAYTLSAELTGVSQVVALVCAPLFGWLGSRYAGTWNAPLLVAAAAGVVGYAALAAVDSPDPKSEQGSGAIFALMVLLGLSQIGAIVCSLGLLARGIEAGDEAGSRRSSLGSAYAGEGEGEGDDEDEGEAGALLHGSTPTLARPARPPKSVLKGAIAGVYSLTGGAGILLLTKLGGYLADGTPGAPFVIVAGFNGLLLAVGLGAGAWAAARRRRALRD